jgi:hypothetical protein
LDVAKCNRFKAKIIFYNSFRLLYGVAKKNRVLQNVMLCGRMRDKKNPAFLQRPDFGLHAVYRLLFPELLSSTNGDCPIVDLKSAHYFEYSIAYYTME